MKTLLIATALFFSLQATAVGGPGSRCAEAVREHRAAQTRVNNAMPGTIEHRQALKALWRAEIYVELACFTDV